MRPFTTNRVRLHADTPHRTLHASYITQLKHLDLLIYQGSMTRCSFSLFRLPEKYLVVQKKAFAAFVKTREDGVSLELRLEGLERYKRTKPDKQSWCHPISALMSQRDSPARISPF